MIRPSERALLKHNHYQSLRCLHAGTNGLTARYKPLEMMFNQFQLFHDSSRQHYSVTVTRCCSYSCFVLLKMGDNETRNMKSSCQTKINSVTCASCWDLYTRILLRCTDPWTLNLRLVSVSYESSSRRCLIKHRSKSSLSTCTLRV